MTSPAVDIPGLAGDIGGQQRLAGDEAVFHDMQFLQTGPVDQLVRQRSKPVFYNINGLAATDQRGQRIMAAANVGERRVR